jgi:hypothetical protein
MAIAHKGCDGALNLARTADEKIDEGLLQPRGSKGLKGNLLCRSKDYYKRDKYTFYLMVLLVLFFLFHLIRNIFIPLHVDEALWWLCMKHPQWAYWYHPPLKIADLYIMTRIFGENPLALRLGSITFSTLALYIAFRFSVDLFKDKRWAFLTTLLIALLPLTNYWMIIGHQEGLFIFTWLLTTYLVWRAVSTSRKGYWYLAGLSAGTMLLNSSRSALFFPTIVLFLLTSKESRVWWRRKEPYLAFSIVLAMFTPSLIWYIGHRFEPLFYQASHHPGFLGRGILDYISYISYHFLRESIVISPFVYLFSIFGIIYGGYLGYFNKGGAEQRFRYLFCFSAPIILFYTITGGTPYWSFCGHLAAIIAAGGAFPILLSRTSKAYLKKLWRPIYIGICLILVFAFTLPALVLTAGDQIQNEWKPLAVKVEELKAEMGGEVPYLAGPYFHIPGEIAYYERDNLAGYTLAFLVYEHAVLSSGSGDYAPWVPLDDLIGKNMIFVDGETNIDDYDTPVSYWEEKLPPYFERVDPPVIFSYTKWGNDVRNFYIFRCYGFKGPDAEMDTKGEIREYVKHHQDTAGQS